MKRIPLATPHMSGNEMKYIEDAFAKNWIAPLGENVDEFEKALGAYVGNSNALATSSGTAAIHLGLKELGVQQGDYVFCSSLTFSASCNPIVYEKAIPVFIDSDESWNMSPKALQDAFEWANKENKLPKAVVVVDLFGQSAKYDEITKICNAYNVPILEDAAEALGASYQGKKCGSFGDMSILSFNGNKIITTSGGGMLFTKTPQQRQHAFKIATQAREAARHYQHEEVGYNYRMSNICAGIGRGQFEILDERVQQKRDIYNRYKKGFENLPIKMMEELPNSFCTHWLSTMTIETDTVTCEDIFKALDDANIEARPVWKPMHLQPVFEDYKFFSSLEEGSVSEYLFNKGICLPSDTKMTIEEQERVIEVIRNCFK